MTQPANPSSRLKRSSTIPFDSEVGSPLASSPGKKACPVMMKSTSVRFSQNGIHSSAASSARERRTTGRSWCGSTAARE